MTAPGITTSPAIRPFRVEVPQADIDDLRARLAHTRWPARETVGDWSQGVRTENARSLIAHWQHEYDWRGVEARLNRLPQFRTTIDGVDIHFIHVVSGIPNAVPLLLTHGWPSSILEFLPLIDPLTDPAAHGGDISDAFDVVIPSLPGFGFSDAPVDTGWTTTRIARAWAELMKRLEYTSWTAHGSDWGAAVTIALGELQPEGLAGIHVTTPYVVPDEVPEVMTPEERRAAEGLAFYGGPLGGSNHLNGTKPQTVAFALADSPAGQAAWIYEKFQSKTDNDGRAEDALDVDVMLDTISLYWFTNSAASASRIYWDNRTATMSGPHLALPVAVTVFPRDTPRMPRSWVEDAYSGLIHFAEAERGGHFAALEQPEILTREIRVGLRSLRRTSGVRA